MNTDSTNATFDAKKAALEIAALWPAFVKSTQSGAERYADFMAEHAAKNGWTIREAFLVDYYFQDGLDEYWKAQDDA